MLAGAASMPLLGVLDALLFVLTALNLGSLMPDRNGRARVVLGLTVAGIGLLGTGAVRHYTLRKDLLLYADVLIALNLPLIGSRRHVRNAARRQVQTGHQVDTPIHVTWRIVVIILVVGGGLLAAEFALVPDF